MCVEVGVCVTLILASLFFLCPDYSCDDCVLNKLSEERWSGGQRQEQRQILNIRTAPRLSIVTAIFKIITLIYSTKWGKLGTSGIKVTLSWLHSSIYVKGIVHPKTNIFSGCPWCRWVCLFNRTDLEKFSITPLAQQWILLNERVPSKWEFKQLIKKKITSCEKWKWKAIPCCPLTSKLFITVFKLFSIVTLLSWFRWDNFITGESNMDRGLVF